ncbi:MAG TPA: thiamine pyrophosphate-dependent enzyme [Solirubrobacteraceae bacterium]|nr:thiamine pyrophosphate-dependent enzyme [Solirubrobacteraceae bacterium]
MTTIFGNPGSTEIPFLTDLPADIRFVLGLHEGTVVGMATGYALARDRPALVNLHTAPGLGNAVNAIANARDCRAPLVIVVGQQDRRALPFEPFLTGRSLERLAGEYPVWTATPLRPQDLPGAIARAYHEAAGAGGPTLVIAPMGDWSQPADELAAGSPAHVVRPRAVAAEDVSALVDLLEAADAPALVVGAGADTPDGWDGVVALAERLGCPVWQEAFGGRAGFPQDHALFAGHLPWMRRRMQEALSGHDLVVAIGTNAFRGYLFDEPVPLVAPGTRVAVLTDVSAEALRSPCDLALVAPVAAACATVAQGVRARERERPAAPPTPPAPAPPGPGEPLRAGHVFAALAQRLPRDVILVEETPSSRTELHRRIPARAPMGFVSGANGALGFGLSGSIGLRLGAPHRPVVAVLGDGASLYTIQAVWSAARYGIGVLLLVMANGGYAVMDALARDHGGSGAWGSFGHIDIAAIATAFGCPSARVQTHEQLLSTLDEVIPTLRGRDQPLLIEVAVAP